MTSPFRMYSIDFFRNTVRHTTFSPQQQLMALCISKCHTLEMGANFKRNAKAVTRNIFIIIHARTVTAPCVKEWRSMNGLTNSRKMYWMFHTFYSFYSSSRIIFPDFIQIRNSFMMLLYHAAHQTMEELSVDPKHLGARIGYICVLHTWGSRMNYHPHLHTIVLGGGLDSANTWKDKGKKFFSFRLRSCLPSSKSIIFVS